MRILATSPKTEARLEFLSRKLDDMAQCREILIVGPTRGAVDDFLRSHALGGDSGRLGIFRYTPLQLALEVAVPGLADDGLTPVSGIALEALTARTAHLLTRDKQFRYFDAVADTIGFRRALGRTLSELRSEAIRPDELSGLGPSGDDLSLLLRQYEDSLLDGRLADPAAVLEIAASRLAVSPGPFGGRPVLLLDLVPNNERETRFLGAVVERASDAMATALPQQGKGMDRLMRVMDQAEVQVDDDAGSDALDRLRRYVFGLAKPERAAGDDSVAFFSATDEGRECMEISRYIQQAAGAGVRFDEIAVLLRNTDAYEPLIKDALSRAGIPSYFTRGSVRPNPAGRAFLALLACRAENLSATRFAEYLSLSQVPDLGEHGKQKEPEPQWTQAQGELFPVADLGEEEAADEEAQLEEDTAKEGDLPSPFAWERLLVDAAVIGGSDRWKTRLGGLAEELRLRLVETGPEDDARSAYLTRQQELLSRLRRFAIPVIEILDDLPESALWREWQTRLESLATYTLGEPTQVLSVLAELRPLGEVGPVSLDEVIQVLTERLSFLRADPSERRYGRVFVGTIPEAAGRCFRAVFLPGVSEGVFPRKVLEDPLLMDEYRSRLGDRLAMLEDRSRQERLLLHIAAGAARDRLYVSYPRTDVRQGRGRVPSFYALEVLRAAEGHIPDLDALERRATAESRSRLGWPSPTDPSLAVDDAEYDLATIGNLMDQTGGDSSGRGSYLLEVNPHLARSLRTRARRWRNFWSEADGIVEPDREVLTVLGRHSPFERTYSPTALQQFAICPYRFLLYAIHRLHPREEAVHLEQLDPLTRGSLFHTTQFRLLSRLRDRDLLPVDASRLDEAWEIADAVLDQTAAEYEADLAPAIRRVWMSEIDRVRTDVRGWLRQEARTRKEPSPWTPRYFEFSFGLEAARECDPASVGQIATILDGVALRGSIDLIEEDSETSRLKLTDHKTGRAFGTNGLTTGGGETLQPMLYALAAETLLDRQVSSSGLYFCTERGDYRRIDVPVNEQARTHIRKAIELIDASLRDGFLPAAPRRGACAHCDYRIVCGPYEELRTERKVAGQRQEQIERLNHLREIP